MLAQHQMLTMQGMFGPMNTPFSDFLVGLSRTCAHVCMKEGGGGGGLGGRDWLRRKGGKTPWPHAVDV